VTEETVPTTQLLMPAIRLAFVLMLAPQQAKALIPSVLCRYCERQKDVILMSKGAGELLIINYSASKSKSNYYAK
jgi:hypothetical protein